MKKITAYKCSHCGKAFLSERGCTKHEEKFCYKAPCNLALCYSCKWYEETGSTESIDRYVPHPYDGHERLCKKEIAINYCTKHNNAKMFNSFHASEELVTDVVENGFTIMPTVQDGCTDYEPKET